MNTQITIRTMLRGALLAACIPGLSLTALAATAGGAKPNTTAHPSTPPSAQAGSRHSSQTMPTALRPALYQALAKDAGATYNINKDGCALLPRQSLKACFDSHGARFSGAGLPLGLRLVAYGRASNLATVTSARPQINGNQASFRHGAINEWWRVLPVGFEQGFTIAKRPSGLGELTLTLAANQPNAAAPSIRHSRENGNPVKTSPSIPLRSEGGKEIAWGKLRYGQLVVTDAKGKVVPAALTAKGNRILIAVNDAHAAYPLTVDPLVWVEQKVTASDGASGDWFGYSVALAGTTALVGAPNATINGNAGQGAAYVFSEAGGSWTQMAKLTASDGAANDKFGWSVALNGTTALIGAIDADINGMSHQGAAYVFGESGGSWSQTQKLTEIDGSYNGDNFGWSVALSGTTALVGAIGALGNDNYLAGAAYIFNESGGTWALTQKLVASDGADFDAFGSSVALVGTTALVGAQNAAVNGNQYQGAAYVFGESGGTWAQTQKLTASDGTADGFFGFSVALDGAIALIGAPQCDSVFDDCYYGPGVAYVFSESDGNWMQTAELAASDGAAGDQFGDAVTLDGATALVGAPKATINGSNFQGAAYVFINSGGVWPQTQKLTAYDYTGYGLFGDSVAFFGTIAFAAAFDDNNSKGAAYFYGQSDLGLAVSAPETVGQGQNYTSQTIATNNASAASPAVTATIAVPAAASFVSAMASQGSCSEASGVVSCDFGAIDGNAGTATADVTLKATGAPGTVVQNVAGIAKAEPPLTASAATTITAGGACPDGYTEYDGTLASGQGAWAPQYQAPQGQENAILTAPAGFQLFVLLKYAGNQRKVFRIPSNEVHRWGPAGTYRWGVRATPASAGGDYTLCLQHP